MDKNSIEPGTAIGNINILDLRKATAETLASISKIGNVNVLLYSRETAPLIPKLNLGNINVSVEAPSDAQAVTGQVIISREFVEGREEPVFLVVTGQVLVKPDVKAEDVEKGIAGLVVVGQILCPEPVLGAIQARTVQLVGQSKAYPATGRLIMGSLTMDETFLKGLEDGSELVILGSLRLPEVLPGELIEQKLARLHVDGGIRVHQANAEMVQARLANGARKMTIIPEGYALVANPLVLDDTVLSALPSPKLFCLERVEVDRATSPELLDELVEKIVVKDALLCPEALKGVMSRKCNILETKALFYAGELWLVDGHEQLSASRFEYLDGKATLVVTGALAVDQDVEPGVLAQRLAKVHNMGAIKCTPEQKGAIQARLGTNEGTIGAGDEEEEPGEGTRFLGNVNHLAL
jgi:hypothetical protein